MEGTISKRNSKEKFNTIRRCLQIQSAADRGRMSRKLAGMFLSAGQEYLHIFVLTRIIDMVNASSPWREIVRFTGIMGLAELALFIAMRTIEKRQNCHDFAYNTNRKKMLWEKVMGMDYVHIEDPDTHIRMNRAQQGMERMDGLMKGMGFAFYGGLMLAAGFFLILPLAFKAAPETRGFVGFIQSTWAFSLVCILVIALELLKALNFEKKIYHHMGVISNDREHIQHGRTAHYYEEEIRGNYRNGGDIRIYNEQGLILGEYEKNENIYIENWLRTTKKMVFYNNRNLTVILASNLLLYGFAAVRAVTGMFTPGEVIAFVMYFVKIRSGVSGISSGLGNMSVDMEFMGTAFEFLDLPDQKYKGSIPTEKRDDNEYEFALKHVWFKYPNSEQYALRDVNLTWKVGEKMALVGKNGCGKSTLIKLLCRLYDPTEGEITLNGVDIRKYKYEDYMALFSVVFQDSGLFSFEVGENVAAEADYDAQRAGECIARAGMGMWLDKAGKGMETCLYKDFDPQGVEISGGEAQKLCLARAIYKGAPFIVLDEPTAALDPISEHDVYTKFNSIVGTRTAVYISHRLSSCRFCDEIVVMEEGTIAEKGSHEDLLEKDGVYRALWTAQAEYYKDTAGELYAG